MLRCSGQGDVEEKPLQVRERARSASTSLNCRDTMRATAVHASMPASEVNESKNARVARPSVRGRTQKRIVPAATDGQKYEAVKPMSERTCFMPGPPRG